MVDPAWKGDVRIYDISRESVKEFEDRFRLNGFELIDWKRVAQEVDGLIVRKDLATGKWNRGVSVVWSSFDVDSSFVDSMSGRPRCGELPGNG